MILRANYWEDFEMGKNVSKGAEGFRVGGVDTPFRTSEAMLRTNWSGLDPEARWVGVFDGEREAQILLERR